MAAGFPGKRVAVRVNATGTAEQADDIAALGGLTPRQAITTPAGLERVKGLLREYEDGEQQQSAAQGRPAVSYQFLWDALGVSR